MEMQLVDCLADNVGFPSLPPIRQLTMRGGHFLPVLILLRLLPRSICSGRLLPGKRNKKKEVGGGDGGVDDESSLFPFLPSWPRPPARPASHAHARTYAPTRARQCASVRVRAYSRRDLPILVAALVW